MRTLVLLLVFLIAQPAFGLDTTAGSNTTCAAWLQGREEMKSYIRKPSGSMPQIVPVAGSWVLGYLEGYEAACPAERTRTYGMDSNAVFDRIDAICMKKPSLNLHLATAELIGQLDDPQHPIPVAGISCDRHARP
jgi:hypothetical protein